MHLLIFGLGFCGRAAARYACNAGWQVTATSRSPRPSTHPNLRIVAFDAAGPDIGSATHLLSTAAPGPEGDPILHRFGTDILAAKNLAWLGYLSTTGVYGDRGGAWVDETTPPAPSAERSRRRLAAEHAWREAAAGRTLDLFRLAGIYGPGRSAFDDLRAGQARRVVQPGHAFGRIHVDDIAAGILAAIAHPPQGTRVLNFSDDLPAESAAVTEEAAKLLGVPVPPAVPYEKAVLGMSDMARSFWAENRRVSSAATQAALHLRWRYPTYREGLRAILAEEKTANHRA
jgi:nucleoside-diphosphate-sugar epimerase